MLSLLTQDYHHTLRQLTLLNVWQTSHSSKQTWMSPASNIEADLDIRKLCLGTATEIDKEAINYYYASSSVGYYITHSSFLHCTLVLNTLHFGTVLQRVRINQLGFHDNLLFILPKKPWYLRLKILMLHPLSRSNGVRRPLLIGDELTEVKIKRFARDIEKKLASRCIRVNLLGFHCLRVDGVEDAGSPHDGSKFRAHMWSLETTNEEEWIST